MSDEKKHDIEDEKLPIEEEFDKEDEAEEIEEAEDKEEESKEAVQEQQSILTEGKPDENKILDLIIKEYSWESVLYNIVVAEDLNPWDIDIIRLADAFAKYISKLREMDFRVPAKVILTCSIFLRMKSEALKVQEDNERAKRQMPERKPLDISDVPQTLQMPSSRRPIRKVTLEELVAALEKAFEVKEKKDRRWEEKVKTIEVHEDKIEERIEQLYKIVMEILSSGMEKVPFKNIVDIWRRENIIKKFMPMLHLAQENRIEYEQEELFKDIFIRLPGTGKETEDKMEEDNEAEEEALGEREELDSKKKRFRKKSKEDSLKEEQEFVKGAGGQEPIRDD